MSVFFENLLGGGKPNNRPDFEGVWRMAEAAADKAFEEIFNVLDKAGQTDFHKFFALFVAVNMVRERLSKAIDNIEKRLGSDGPLNVRAVHDEVDRIFRMTEQERANELRKRKGQ